MLHAGDMDFDTTAKSMTLFAREVAPQLKNLGTKRAGFGPLGQRRTVMSRNAIGTA